MAGARGLTNGEAPVRGSSRRAGPAPAAGPRATLTIGEAAARLSAEFPGVTVGVLRRLERAGKFTPGRGATGYRRYSEADLDLIRLVLSDHLAAADAYAAGSADADAALSGGYAAAPDPADLSGAESPPTHPAVGAPDALRHAQRPVAARTGSRAARTATSRVPAARTAAAGTRGPSPAIATLFDVGYAADTTQHAEALRPDALLADRDGVSGRASGVGAPSAPPTPASAPTTTPTATRRADRRWPDAEFFAPDLGEVALDRDQLAAAARTDRAWVDGLVEYGLLPGAQSAGGADLLVARASAELAQFGVEPRHLKAVAASAARVAELIAAATQPGSGRDPARRERALLAAPGRSAEAAAAAVRLHAALVRAALLRS